MKKIIKSILIIAIIVLINTKVYATTGKLTSDNVRVREEANTNSKILTLASIGEKVEILEQGEEWTKVKYSEFTGYIRNDMLEVLQDTENTPNTENNESNDNVDNNIENAENGENKENTDNNNSTENNENTQKVEEKTEKLKKDVSYSIPIKIDLKIIPSINSSVVAGISENSNFYVKDIINKWCYIENGSSCGWTLKSKIEAYVPDETVNENNVEENAEQQGEEQQNEEQENKEQENIEEKEQETQQEENKSNEKEVNETKYVSVSALNLRKKANSNSEVIDQLSINTKVTVTVLVDNTWAKVTYNNKTGYVAYRYLSDSKTAVTSRSESINRENLIQKDVSGSETTSENTSANNDTSNTKEASVSKETSTKETAETTKSTSSTASSSVTGADVVAYAKQYLGCKYVYGGSTPSGFDCSGFTSYVYKHFGYSLNRTSSGQRSNGVAVDKANLKAGDILCFNGHVGIYIGGGSFIHAANPSKGVIISSLSESYYTKNYITARRIL